MSEIIFGIFGGITFMGMLVYVPTFLYKMLRFQKYLKKEKRDKWEELGAPHIFLNNSLATHIKTNTYMRDVLSGDEPVSKNERKIVASIKKVKLTGIILFFGFIFSIIISGLITMGEFV